MDDCDLDSPTTCEDEESASFDDNTTELTETADDDDSATVYDSEPNSDTDSGEWSDDFDESDCTAGETSSDAVWENCVGKPCDEERRIPLGDEKSACWNELACEDGIWIKDMVCDYIWTQSGSQTESGSGTEEEECSGSCCPGESSVAECLGQPCDAPDRYGTSDSRGAYSSEIQKS